jgi:16S rRNA processing protein RimM
VGRIVRPHGLDGEMVVQGTPLEPPVMAALGRVTLARDQGEVVRTATVVEARAFQGRMLVRFEGIGDAEAAGELRGLWIEADRAALPEAGPREIYHYDLLGLEVVEADGRSLGRVTRVLATGAHEVLEVRGDAGELLLPYHPGTVLGWDPVAGRITVRLPAGLEGVYRSPARSD